MASDSLVGRQLANFKVERLLGRGGMAEVYFGRDVNLQRPVAIKVIDARFRSDPGYADRFISEARAIASWRHENIVQVYYADKSDDIYYFVMEYIDGMDLDSLLRKYADAGELIPHKDVIQIGKAIASALDYAHKRDVIHRDIKPANVMVASNDRIVLMDFGLALDVQQGSLGEVFGTPHYVSPEQARRSADAMPQSDVYSLGIMLYEMLTGVVPFDDPSPTAVALQHLSMPPPSPRSLNKDLSQQVEDVLLKALAKEPEDRYQSAQEFINALEAALSQKVDIRSVAELPPLPPGMEPPERSMSGRTVAEHIALNIQQTETQTTPEIPASSGVATQPPAAASVAHPVQTAPPSRSNRGWLLLIPVVLLLAVVGGVFLFSGGNGDALPTAAPTAGAALAATETIIPTDAPPTATEVMPSATSIPPTATDVPPTETDVPPTATAVQPTTTSRPPTATTVPPTATTVPPTVTTIPPTATTRPPTATIVAAQVEPTVLYPNGQRVQLRWNRHSFYWQNPTGNSMRVSPIDFEALDADGNRLSYAFDGARWTIGFSSVESGRCVAIEILQTTDWLRPSACRGYNSTLTLRRDDVQVFWLPRNGATQFRVLWDGQEVGRCQIEDQACEVRVP